MLIILRGVAFVKVEFMSEIFWNNSLRFFIYTTTIRFYLIRNRNLVNVD